MTPFGPDKPIRIVSLQKTCRACPAQWEGETDHGAVVYLHYRWGELTVYVGPDIDTALDRAPVYVWDSGDDLHGYMERDELAAVLPPWITLPEDGP